jgi:hypothetical protein
MRSRLMPDLIIADSTTPERKLQGMQSRFAAARYWPASAGVLPSLTWK